MTIASRLEELGITLPAPAAPVAAYVPAVEANGLLHISGQLPFREDGSLITGRLGESIDAAAGAEAARRCGIMLVAQIKAALGGDLDRVERIVQLFGFVNSDPDFKEQPRVINGAVDLFVELYGERGLPTRTAIGCHGLFGDFPLEIVVTVLFSGTSVRHPLPRDGRVTTG